MTLDAAMVRRCAEHCAGFLEGSVDASWSVPIPDMTWSVAEAVAHMAQALLWYSSDFAAGPGELTSVELKVDASVTNSELIRTVRTLSRVLAGVVATTEDGWLGWHPYGTADASGFVGMACDELLVHTSDAASGLGREFDPPTGIADATLSRLFPWAPKDVDPWSGLKWANGRIELPGHGRLTKWRWHCAPLSEWDGSDPCVRG
jgi:uncharacterized protein (TIGR03083 family)